MSVAPNPLSEMANIKSNVLHKDGRPNPSLAKKALPGFQTAVRSRRSIRIFDGSPIPRDVMMDCLRDATLSPSSSNLQTYELYWIQDEQKKKAIVDFCLSQPAAETAGDLIVVVSRADLWRKNLHKLIDIMTDKGQRPLDEPIHDYYHKIVPLMRRTDAFGFWNLFRRVYFWYKGWKEPTMRTPVNRADHRVYGHIQATFVAQTLMLSLAAHGYESCPIGGMDKLSIRQLLELPSSAEVSLVIAAGTGKPEGQFGPRVRLPFEDLVKQV